jgi:tetratricopeptide (TPR) repeat protein
VLLNNKDNIRYSISNYENEKDIEPIIDILDLRKKSFKDQETVSNEDKITKGLVFWDIVINDLEEKEYQTKEISNGDYEVNMQIDLTSGKMVTSTDSFHTLANKNIAVNIHNVLEEMFSEYDNEIVIELNKAIDSNDMRKAFSVFEDAVSKGVLQLSPSINLLKLLKKMDKSSLEFEQRKEVFEGMFYLAGRLKQFSIIEKEANQYLKEYKGSIDKDRYLNILVVRGNGAAQNEKKELAFSIYKQVTDESKELNIHAAWAHRGIALLLDDEDPQKYNHIQLAIDSFLQAGNRREAVNSKLGLAKLLQNDDDFKAVTELEDALSWLNNNDPIEKIIIANLYHIKAKILFNAEDYENALEKALESVKIREGLIHNQKEVISSLNLIIIIAEKLNKKDLILEKKEEIGEIEKTIDDKEYELRKKLSNLLDNNKLDEIKELEEEIEKHDNIGLRIAFYVSLSIENSSLNFIDKLNYLEEALYLVRKGNGISKEEKETVFFAFGELYKQHKKENKAIEWYKKTLDCNPYNYIARQNYTALLWNNNRWEESLNFFIKQRELFGDLPNVLFGYGRSLLEMGQANKAAKPLYRAYKKSGEKDFIQEYYEKAMEQADSISKDKLNEESEVQKTITRNEFEKCLDEFIDFIEKDKRMTFWRTSNGNKKWTSSPEQHGQNLFHTFIKAYFNKEVDVFEEINSGAGRADIYLKFTGGLKIILELKMCGGGYSNNYAIEGEDQLIHYLENRNTHIGYLVVFDGRIRDYGKGFSSRMLKDNYSIFFTKAIDVRYKVK